MSVVKINAVTVPRADFGEFVRRFRTPADEMPDAAGFEGFELLEPDDDRSVFFVLTRWRSDADFKAWARSPDFAARHARHQAVAGQQPGTDLPRKNPPLPRTGASADGGNRPHSSP